MRDWRSRPRKAAMARVTAYLGARVTPEMYRAVADAAAREGLTVGDWLRRAIQNTLRK